MSLMVLGTIDRITENASPIWPDVRAELRERDARLLRVVIEPSGQDRALRAACEFFHNVDTRTDWDALA